MNLTYETRKYIDSHPHVKHCIKKGIINYAALARTIQKEEGLKTAKPESIIIAARRYAESLTSDKRKEKKVLDVLKGSELIIKNKVSLIALKRQPMREKMLEIEQRFRNKAEVLHVVEGASAVTVVISERYAKEVEKAYKNHLLSTTKGLCQIILKSDEQILEVSGILSYLASLFSAYDINIVEEMSSYTDSMFFIAEKDLSKAIAFLQF